MQEPHFVYIYSGIFSVSDPVAVYDSAKNRFDYHREELKGCKLNFSRCYGYLLKTRYENLPRTQRGDIQKDHIPLKITDPKELEYWCSAKSSKTFRTKTKTRK